MLPVVFMCCYVACCSHVLLRCLLCSRVSTLLALFTCFYVACCVDVFLRCLLCKYAPTLNAVVGNVSVAVFNNVALYNAGCVSSGQ